VYYASRRSSLVRKQAHVGGPCHVFRCPEPRGLDRPRSKMRALVFEPRTKCFVLRAWLSAIAKCGRSPLVSVTTAEKPLTPTQRSNRRDCRSASAAPWTCLVKLAASTSTAIVRRMGRCFMLGREREIGHDRKIDHPSISSTLTGSARQVRGRDRADGVSEDDALALEDLLMQEHGESIINRQTCMRHIAVSACNSTVRRSSAEPRRWHAHGPCGMLATSMMRSKRSTKRIRGDY